MRRIWTPQPYEDRTELKAYFCGGVDKLGLPSVDNPPSPTLIPYWRGWVEGLEDNGVLMFPYRGNFTETGLREKRVGNQRQYPVYLSSWSLVPIAFPFYGGVDKPKDEDVWIDEETYILKIRPHSPLWDDMMFEFISILDTGFLNLYINSWFEFLFPYQPEFQQDTGVPLWGYESKTNKVWNTDLYLVFEKDAVYIITGEGWKLYQLPYDDFSFRNTHYLRFEIVSCLNEEPPPMGW